MIIRKLFIEVTIIPDMYSTPQKGVIDTSSIISIRKEESGYVIIETKDKDVRVAESYNDLLGVLTKNNCIRVIK